MTFATALRARARVVLRSNALLVDAAVAGLLTIVGLGRLFLPQLQGWLDYREPDTLGILLVVASALPLVVRRRWPVPVLLAVSAATVALSALSYSSGGTSLLVAVYTVAVHRPRDRSLRLLVVALLAAAASLVLSPQQVPLGAWVENAAVFVTAWVLGDSQRTRRAYVAEVEARAERAERDRELEARVAVDDERRRIARELHDVVAHNVSVMVVQAAGARRSLPEAAEVSAEALHVVESTGREALDEMRRLLGVLRTDQESGDELTPQPGVEDLPALLDQVREAGLPVAFAVEGERRPLPPGVNLTLFRVVQESLTNSLKHAAPTTASVVVRYGPTGVEVEVCDTGSTDSMPRPRAGGGKGGFGLLGMRERVALFDGALHAGRRPDGGFGVRARLPLHERITT